jgi:excisionase family DNA binding protein
MSAASIGSENERECVSLREASFRLSVCVRTVRREIDRGRLRAFRVGRNLRVSLSELRRYMESEVVAV